MRSLRFSMAAAWLLGLTSAHVMADDNASPATMLKYAPSLNGVDYERVAPKDVATCKLAIDYIGKRAAGYILRDAQGKTLRRFIDATGKGQMNQWSYFQDGFEVYRETDLNGDMAPDECRWLNQGGTRIASVADSKITGWKRLSAEEASKVLVQAIVTGDGALLETVMATADELNEMGVPKSVVEQAARDAQNRVAEIDALQRAVSALGWNKATVWNRLDGMMPQLIPADPGTGLKNDLLMYENAVIFAGPPNGQANPARLAFLQAPEMVRVGETWKFVTLPKAIDPQKPVIAAQGGIRSALMGGQGPEGPNGPINPQLEEARKALAKYQTDNASLLSSGKKEDLARFHYGMVARLNECLKHAPTPAEKLAFGKQIVESIATAYQTGAYPKGKDALQQEFIARGGALGAYAAYALINAEFGLQNEQNPGELLANQKKWMDELKKFVADFPEGERVPDALYNLASGNEFLAEEAEARKYYTELRDKFGDTDSGKKAAGALRRLDLVGKSIELKGPGLDKGVVDLAQYRGKVVLVAFWASWAEPARRELPELLKVYQKNKSRGLEVVGVSFDNDRKELEAFVKEQRLPWAEIFEEGGMDSPLAVEYGIISMPTMFLIDADGKVVNRNVRMGADVEKQLEKVLGAKKGGVAFGGDR